VAKLTVEFLEQLPFRVAFVKLLELGRMIEEEQQNGA
jgi:hypothetical protein